MRHENSEIYNLGHEHDVVKFIKFGRLIWAGQMMRMEEVTLKRNSFTLKEMEMEMKGEVDQS
jgi:hypothetical protein